MYIFFLSVSNVLRLKEKKPMKEYIIIFESMAIFIHK